MPTTFHLRVWTRFLAPVADVWRIKTDPALLAEEFAPYGSNGLTHTDVLQRALAGEVPASGEGTLRIGGFVPVAWPVTITEVTHHASFRDTSVNKLFSRYEHEHLFEETPDGCRYVDAITFVSTAPAQKLTAILVKRLFEHRHRVAAKRLPTDPEATGIAMLRVLVEDEDEQRKVG